MKKDGNVTGRIYKGIGGFYYIKTENEKSLLETRARGRLRKSDGGLLVGDYVSVEDGQVHRVIDRRNALLRPAVANVSQAIILISAKDPRTSYMFLDRLIVHLESRDVDIVLALNKSDLADDMDLREYEMAGYPVLKLSALHGDGVNALLPYLSSHTTVLAGESGVGKSTLLNALREEHAAKTGEVSKKLGRGRHTTRHSELFDLDNGGVLVDSPGFGNVEVFDVQEGELRELFVEFLPYQSECRFNSCTHSGEPQCAVKEAVVLGKIGERRYQNYLHIYKELKKHHEKI